MVRRLVCIAGGLLLIATACNDNTGMQGVVPLVLPVDISHDVVYAELATAEGTPRALDVYAPRRPGPESGWPVVLLLHGGGATKDNPALVTVARQLAESGFVVVVPTHGATSPERAIANDGKQLRESFERTRCALRYAAARASGYGGDPAAISVVGHSAGGLLGMMVVLGGQRAETGWIDLGADRDVQQSLQCTASEAVPPLAGFVGLNGAYFLFMMSGLAESDPQLYSLVNPREFLTPGSASIRMILGGEDAATPSWHVDEVEVFAAELNAVGYDAETVVIDDAGHNWITAGPAWDVTVGTIRSVADPE